VKEELKKLFEEVRRLGAAVEPLTKYDSIVITTCTQLDFAYSQSPQDALAVCDRLLNHLVCNTVRKLELFQTVRTTRVLIGSTIP
jgi:hypothetical protein